jgi:hypothetical protein
MGCYKWVLHRANPGSRSSRLGLGGASCSVGAEGSSGGWGSWRRQVGAAGNQDRRIGLRGKEENVSGSLCGGRGCSFVGKLKEAHFSLLPSFVSTTGFRELFGPPKLIFKA